MILELADIRIQPGRQAEFDEAIQRGVATVISRARGFRGFKVHKGIESPERYVLTIFWETLEDHTVHFRGGPLFAEWRRRWSSTSRCSRGRPEGAGQPAPSRRASASA